MEFLEYLIESYLPHESAFDGFCRGHKCQNCPVNLAWEKVQNTFPSFPLDCGKIWFFLATMSGEL